MKVVCMRTEFPTNRGEVELVAKIFDREGTAEWMEGQPPMSPGSRGRGRVVARDFIESLREAAKANNDLQAQASPEQEAEFIQDAVQKKASECTCITPYKINRVGENRYRVCLCTLLCSIFIMSI